MKELRPSSEQDLPQVQLENELLKYEVRHLRARIAAFQRAGEESAGPEVDRLRQELQQTRDDLRWLLNRLATSPAGALLRRYEGFRILLERYRVGEGP